jgi:NAD(P)H-hydrate epimerase
VQSVFAIKLDEAMSLPLEDEGQGLIVPAAVPALLQEAAQRDALVIGPGIGTAASTRAAVQAVLAALDGPAVVDADGLNAFAAQPQALRSAAARVLTPHPGEAARLLGCETREVQADRAGSVRRLAAESGAVVVLKGSRTLICTPDGAIDVNLSGSAELATGGTGDVLGGAIAALLAQGLSALDAARVGVFAHGRAGQSGRRGTPAGAIAARIPDVLEALRASLAREEEGVDADPGSDRLHRFV